MSFRKSKVTRNLVLDFSLSFEMTIGKDKHDHKHS